MQISPGANSSSIFAQIAASITQAANSAVNSESAPSTTSNSASSSTSSQPPTSPSFNPDVPGAGAASTMWTISSGSDVRFSAGVSSPCAPSSYPWLALSSQDVGLAEAATGDTLKSLPNGQYHVVEQSGTGGDLTDMVQLENILDTPLTSGNITANNFANAVQNLQQNGTPLTQSGITSAYNYISSLISSQDSGQQTPQDSVNA